MWIFERVPRSALREPAIRLLEGVGLAFACAFLPELLGADGRAPLDPHPVWIAVVVLAARYGVPGFFTGLVAAAGAVAAAAGVAGTRPVDAWIGLQSGGNLIALGTCQIVAWIGSGHRLRQADLADRNRELSRRAADGEAATDALLDAIATLRARVDRATASLSFLRDVARRLDGSDPRAAAEAAAELALARTGASAVAVKVGVGRSERVWVVRDSILAGSPPPAAFRGADVSVPIRAGDHRVGALELWDLPPTAANDATTNDLSIIASWCGPTLAAAAWQRTEDAGRVRGES